MSRLACSRQGGAGEPQTRQASLRQGRKGRERWLCQQVGGRKQADCGRQAGLQASHGRGKQAFGRQDHERREVTSSRFLSRLRMPTCRAAACLPKGPPADTVGLLLALPARLPTQSACCWLCPAEGPACRVCGLPAEGPPADRSRPAPSLRSCTSLPAIPYPRPHRPGRCARTPLGRRVAGIDTAHLLHRPDPCRSRCVR